MRRTGWSAGFQRLLGVGWWAFTVAAAPACGRPDPDAPPPSPARVLAPAVDPAPADPLRVSFLVPAFAQRFGHDALVDVVACRESVCARATVVLGDSFSAALPATATAAEVTARIVRDTGALKVTLQVPAPGATGAAPARSLGLTVTPTTADAGYRRPYVQVVLPGCDEVGASAAPVTCSDGDATGRGD
jgi:hypothetical protein